MYFWNSELAYYVTIKIIIIIISSSSSSSSSSSISIISIISISPPLLTNKVSSWKPPI